jgi:Chaperone of endosialidase
MARIAASVCALSLALAGPVIAARPIAVSPGSPSGEAVVAGRCPTFHWSAPPGAVAQELVVYPAPNPPPDDAGELEPVLQVDLPAGLGSWTPDLARCLEPGTSYAWSVRAVLAGGANLWSEASLFRISAEPSSQEVEEALDILGRWEASRSPEDAAAAKAERDTASTTAPAALAALQPGTARPLAAATGAPAAVAPTLSANPSLTVDGQIHLAAASQIFKGSDLFLWSDATANDLALGEAALSSNSTGARNVALGSLSMESNTTGYDNVALGHEALRYATGSVGSVAIGKGALRNATGAYNIALGIDAGSGVTTGSGSILIGNPGVATDGTLISNESIRIGFVQKRAFIAGIQGITTGNNNAIPVLIDNAGQLGTASSSIRFKRDVRTQGELSRRLLDLRPVTFRYKQHGDQGPPQFGLIAEEVAKVFPELVLDDDEGRPFAVRYDQMPSLLLNELQRQEAEIRVQKWANSLLLAAALALAVRLRMGRKRGW